MNIEIKKNTDLQNNYENDYWSRIDISLVENPNIDNHVLKVVEKCYLDSMEGDTCSYYFYDQLIKDKNITLYTSPIYISNIICHDKEHPFCVSVNTSCKYNKEPDSDIISNTKYENLDIDKFYITETDGYLCNTKNGCICIFIPAGTKIKFDIDPYNNGFFSASIMQDYVKVKTNCYDSSIKSFHSIDRKDVVIFNLNNDTNTFKSMNNIDKMLKNMHPNIDFSQVMEISHDI
jgi:hypothetical protein